MKKWNELGLKRDFMYQLKTDNLFMLVRIVSVRRFSVRLQGINFECLKWMNASDFSEHWKEYNP